MNFLDTVPAIRRIDTNRDDLFAVDVVGHVTAADAENLFGLLEAAYLLHDRIDVLVRVIDPQGVEWANIQDETLEQGTVHALQHISRCATVGDPNWIPAAREFMPASSALELRHFKVEDESVAWQWLGARPIEQPT